MTISELITNYNETLAKLTDAAECFSTLEGLLAQAIAKESYASFKTSNYIVTDAVRDIRKTRQALENFAVDDYATLRRILAAANK